MTSLSGTGGQPKLPNSQYHHFIPRFILRNFTHPPNQASKGSRSKKKGGHRHNEPMLYTLDLSKPTTEITETSVSRTFGLTDMYRDFKHASNQHYLEEQLSKLESNAGRIIRKIQKGFEAGDADVWLTRPDRDTLRKFLFIMKYRSSRMHKRFYHKDTSEYSENDKEILLPYMRKKGFTKPVDVWFDNIKAMLELKMDPQGKWMNNLLERIYPDDAKWFISHTQMMYLSLCKPSSEDDEFLLTENAYGIHEGPSSFNINENTGELIPGSYTEYHVFAVISPRLIMVLRSFLLPVPEEDFDEEIREYRQTMHRLNYEQHNFPESSESVLADLPITKPRNSYSRIVGGRVVLLEGEDGTRRSDHKFLFRFFPLTTTHVDKINAIMLEQSTRISAIVIKSRAGARKTIESYLKMPLVRTFKTVSDVPDDPMLLLLKKLEQVVKQLGGDAVAVYRVQRYKMSRDEKFAKLDEMTETMGHLFEKHLPQQPSEDMQLYIKLGR
jgi:hypothetical protein